MIPSELRDRKQWVCWSLVDGRKVPFHPQRKAVSTTNADTWSTYEACATASDKIGFVFTPDDPYIGIDLDGCRNPKTQIIETWAWEVIERFATYSEISPSGTGVKIWGAYDGGWKHANKKTLPGDHCGVEVYQTGRYFCVTGQFIVGYEDIANVTGAMEWFAEKFELVRKETPQAAFIRKANSNTVADRASAYVSKIPPAVSGQGGHNAAFHVACVLANGFMLDMQDAKAVFYEYNARCVPPWSEKEIDHKIKSALGSKGERGQLLNTNSREWVNTPLPTSWNRCEEIKKPKREVTFKTLEQSSRDVAANIKAGRKSLTKLGIPNLDYAIGGGVDVGEVVIIGARPSHGKSAIALQMVHHLTNEFAVGIVSQEMSALALGKRTLQFITEVPQDDWAMRGDEIDLDINSHFEERKHAYIIEGVADIGELCDTAEKMMEEKNIKVLFIDYAQIITGFGKTQYEKVTDVSSRLRKLATATGLVVVALAQLGRDIEKRPEFHPSGKDLKDSGQLEQDADVILFGVWPFKIDQKADRNHYQFFVDKNRNREIVCRGFDVHFEPHRQRYLDNVSLMIGNEFSKDF